ncbi:MAG: tRNA 4-thiouridine(8) synthase ThiI [Candidatus Magasanikbacteria bacterium]|jgi:tRNA uracil 4-sulfurtransferase|nr:tRNA 4-thiouridine(8) synthase ThiI [Candidatus Magasanikbacteria bacterium]MBT4315314.1 tRNA 4-thiouridine(8) synthase ThiI [Candidatus Magasanikbacteria bacterium]MBT4547186.1 tRNA 4-thiouridine(8) synthase ThiI [Candidatus Magasanikbacteria bacterium]MBT6819674.1 tRNA 4-thiouridine(8) synthase ThiI [Candidatus Magasanikbacteria bacterium]
MSSRVIIVHYDEIAIKGKNRPKFEGQLVDNIREKIKIAKLKGEVQKKYGRLDIVIPELDQKEDWIRLLQTTFGIANFSFAVLVEQDLEVIKNQCLEEISKQEFETFRITTQRSNKNFPIGSMEVSKEVGAYVFENLKKKVDLFNPDTTCFISIVDNFALIYSEKIQGPGGLPVGINGKAVVLLSGGIDSPVAAWYAMKRGLRISFVHFHSAPYTSQSSIDKVEELAEILRTYSPNAKLTSIAFGDIQKKLKLQIPEKYLIIFYRRYMLRLAEKQARESGAKVLITGEALGQVASQTLENMIVVEQAIEMMILRPLIGFDKKEIIVKAKEIGTFETSILPHDDCCTLFMPKSPETRAKLADILEIEAKIDLE